MEDSDFFERVSSELDQLRGEVGEFEDDVLFEIWFAQTFFPTLELGTIVEKYHIGGSGDNRIDLGIVVSNILL